QGTTAAAEIARAVGAFSRPAADDVADVLIVARGGGSRDDLSAFNDERVVRAVAGSRIPTLAAVGRGIDVTLTALAAGVRAATPSQAAAPVVARKEELERLLSARTKELTAALRSVVADARAGVAGAAARVERFGVAVDRAALTAAAAHASLLGGMRALPGRF